MDVFIEPMGYDSIDELAALYVKVYKKSNLREKGDISLARKFIMYFYELCSDLFFCSKVEEIIAGIWDPVKLWWDGNKVYDLGIFIDSEYQGRG